MVKVSYVRYSGRKHPVSYKHKENCKTFSDISFLSLLLQKIQN